MKLTFFHTSSHSIHLILLASLLAAFLFLCFYHSALAAFDLPQWMVNYPNGSARHWEEQGRDTHGAKDLRNQFVHFLKWCDLAFPG